jgi:hypothetical protein
MYLQVKKYKQVQHKYWFDTIITHIGLYKDDWTYIKFIKHDPKILDLISNARIEISIPEIREFIKDEEIEKILPKAPNLFNL